MFAHGWLTKGGKKLSKTTGNIIDPDALIEALHSTQEAFGYIDDDALRYVGDSLSVPPSTVFGVALAVPPLDTSSAPSSCSVRASSAMPVLS